MTKQLQSVEQEESLTPAEQLEAILFQFVNLYERWSEDRQVAAKQGADIAKFVKEFTDQVEHFESIEEFVRAQIRSSMNDATVLVASSISRAATDAIQKETSRAADDIRDAVSTAKGLLTSYQSSLNMTHWKMLGAMVLSSIATSLLIVYFLTPKPTLPLTGNDIQIYELGRTFSQIWPTISEEKKRWFLKETNRKASI
jgi:hypothetical protein